MRPARSVPVATFRNHYRQILLIRSKSPRYPVEQLTGQYPAQQLLSRGRACGLKPRRL
jgi:hypothetical protein